MTFVQKIFNNFNITSDFDSEISPYMFESQDDWPLPIYLPRK